VELTVRKNMADAEHAVVNEADLREQLFHNAVREYIVSSCEL
jgi:hypothetical protein